MSRKSGKWEMREGGCTRRFRKPSDAKVLCFAQASRTNEEQGYCRLRRRGSQYQHGQFLLSRSGNAIGPQATLQLEESSEWDVE